MSNDNLNVNPVILQRSFLKNWWILTLGLIIGGLVGLVMSVSLPPVYEATFIIVTNVRIDGTKEITEIMLDAAINHIGDLAYNPVIVERMVTALNKQGVQVDFEEIMDITFIERRLNSTHLKARWRDPDSAMKVANTWGLILYDMLQEGYKQAVIADDLTAYQETLKACLLDEDSSGCGTYCGLSKEDLQGEITRVSFDIAARRNESLGLYSELTISDYQEADFPEKPTFYEQRSLILAGMGIGFLLSLLLLEVWLPSRRGEG